MPTFQAVSDDEQRMSTYILQRCPPELKADLDSYTGPPHLLRSGRVERCR